MPGARCTSCGTLDFTYTDANGHTWVANCISPNGRFVYECREFFHPRETRHRVLKDGMLWNEYVHTGEGTCFVGEPEISDGGLVVFNPRPRSRGDAFHIFGKDGVQYYDMTAMRGRCGLAFQHRTATAIVAWSVSGREGQDHVVALLLEHVNVDHECVNAIIVYRVSATGYILTGSVVYTYITDVLHGNKLTVTLDPIPCVVFWEYADDHSFPMTQNIMGYLRCVCIDTNRLIWTREFTTRNQRPVILLTLRERKIALLTHEEQRTHSAYFLTYRLQYFDFSAVTVLDIPALCVARIPSPGGGLLLPDFYNIPFSISPNGDWISAGRVDYALEFHLPCEPIAVRWTLASLLVLIMCTRRTRQMRRLPSEILCYIRDEYML
jgi:hypothetical protein